VLDGPKVQDNLLALDWRETDDSERDEDRYAED
jgi:hypothetical protein